MSKVVRFPLQYALRVLRGLAQNPCMSSLRIRWSRAARTGVRGKLILTRLQSITTGPYGISSSSTVHGYAQSVAPLAMSPPNCQALAAHRDLLRAQLDDPDAVRSIRAAIRDEAVEEQAESVQAGELDLAIGGDGMALVAPTMRTDLLD